jgi:D-xylose transport system substrate-binding protein
VQSRLMAVGLAALAVLAGACGSSGPSGGGIALLLPSADAIRFEGADRPAFEAQLKSQCPDVAYTYANAGGDAALQQQQAEAAIAGGARVLVLDPQDADAAGRIVTDARARGVRVISYDRLIRGGSTPDVFVSYDSEAIGKLQGTALLAKLTDAGKTKPKVVWINGNPDNIDARLVAAGAHSALDGRVVIVPSEQAMTTGTSEDAGKLMEAAIKAVGAKGFDGVYVADDAGAAGVSDAMQADGMNPASKPITGSGPDLAAIQRILLGRQYMTVYGAIGPEAEAAAQVACDMALGKAPTTGNVPVNNGTADIASVLLAPVPVTADGSIGTSSIQETVVADAYYGTDSVARICDATVDPGLPAACTTYGVK